MLLRDCLNKKNRWRNGAEKKSEVKRAARRRRVVCLRHGAVGVLLLVW